VNVSAAKRADLIAPPGACQIEAVSGGHLHGEGERHFAFAFSGLGGLGGLAPLATAGLTSGVRGLLGGGREAKHGSAARRAFHAALKVFTERSNVLEGVICTVAAVYVVLINTVSALAARLTKP
jgi:hypothetical protein